MRPLVSWVGIGTHRWARWLFAAGLAVASAGPVPAQDFGVFSTLGDSLLDVPEHRGPSPAEHIAARLGVAVNNFAIDGSTTTDLLALQQDVDAAAAGTTFAVIWVGGNDILFAHTFETLAGDAAFVAQSVANIDTALNTLQNAGADVLLANLSDLSVLPASSSGIFALSQEQLANVRRVTQEFNEQLQRVADERGIPVVDVFGWYDEFRTSAPQICGQEIGLPPDSGGVYDMYADEIHPSSLGMALITNEFIRTMNAAYGLEIELLTSIEIAAQLGLMDCDDEIPDDETAPEAGGDPENGTNPEAADDPEEGDGGSADEPIGDGGSDGGGDDSSDVGSVGNDGSSDEPSADDSSGDGGADSDDQQDGPNSEDDAPSNGAGGGSVRRGGFCAMGVLSGLLLTLVAMGLERLRTAHR